MFIADGSVYSFGQNDSGQIGINSTNKKQILFPTRIIISLALIYFIFIYSCKRFTTRYNSM